MPECVKILKPIQNFQTAENGVFEIKLGNCTNTKFLSRSG